jgi:hypothetical protein
MFGRRFYSPFLSSFFCTFMFKLCLVPIEVPMYLAGVGIFRWRLWFLHIFSLRFLFFSDR